MPPKLQNLSQLHTYILPERKKERNEINSVTEKNKKLRFVGRRFEKTQKDPNKPAIKTVYLPKIINRAIWKT
jgi:hypothetical protein